MFERTLFQMVNSLLLLMGKNVSVINLYLSWEENAIIYLAWVIYVFTYFCTLSWPNYKSWKFWLLNYFNRPLKMSTSFPPESVSYVTWQGRLSLLISWPWDREIILDSLGVPNTIPSLKSESQRKSVRMFKRST